MPRVTIALATRDGSRHLREALASLLGQTFDDFELLVVDDGSTDDTAELLTGVDDGRVRVLQHPTPRGLAVSLNELLAQASGDYIARMDADDVADPRRLEQQVDFLDEHPRVAIVGSACVLIDDEGRPLGVWRHPVTSLEVRFSAMLQSPFAHPSVLLRRSTLVEHRLSYNAHLDAGQDYDLWVRVLAVADGANLAEPLLRYRRHAHQTTEVLRGVQLEVHERVVAAALDAELPGHGLGPEHVHRLCSLVSGAPLRGEELRRAVSAYLSLHARFADRHAGDAGLGAVRAQVALVLARAARGAGGHTGAGLLARALRVDPRLPLHWFADTRRARRRAG